MNLRTATRGASTLTIALVTLALLSGTALAYWTSIGVGSGQASAGTVLAPTGVSANPISGSSTSLRVAWSHPSGLQPTSYGVTAGSQSCSATYPAAMCDVTGLTASTAYSVVVTSRYNNAWTAPAGAVTGTTNPAAPTLVFSSPSATTNVPVNTTFGGTTNGTGTVTVTIYTGAAATGTPAGTLTATPSGGNWTTGEATLTSGTQYTAVASQSNAGGTTSQQKTFTTAAAAPTATITLTGCTDDGPNNKSTCTGTYTGSLSTITISWSRSGSTTVTKTENVSGGTFAIQSQNGLATGTWTATATSGSVSSNSTTVTIN